MFNLKLIFHENVQLTCKICITKELVCTDMLTQHGPYQKYSESKSSFRHHTNAYYSLKKTYLNP